MKVCHEPEAAMRQVSAIKGWELTERMGATSQSCNLPAEVASKSYPPPERAHQPPASWKAGTISHIFLTLPLLVMGQAISFREPGVQTERIPTVVKGKNSSSSIIFSSANVQNIFEFIRIHSVKTWICRGSTSVESSVKWGNKDSY